LRAAVGALFLIGTLGTGVELLLLGHTEDVWQISPLGLMAVGLFTWTWFVAGGGRTVGRGFQVVMGLLVLSGVIGLWLHYRANVEFELEMYPSLAGVKLWWEAARGATPALAPGAMLELGLLGLAYTYRHPVLDRVAQPTGSSGME
jgi:hypothetical protein